MARTVRFLFDFVSPTSYLAWAQLPGLKARTGAEIVLEPVLLGAIFKATGNASPITTPAKAAWMMGDLHLWARRHGIPMTMNPNFPLNSVRMQRAATAALARGELDALAGALFPAMWRDARNLGDPEVLSAVIAEAGLDAGAYDALVEDETVKADLKNRTDAAIAAGAFGVPTFLVGERLFFGSDRIDFVADALLESVS